MALYTWRLFLKGRTAIIFNDSTSAESILVRGYSNAAWDANEITSEFWSLAAELEICVCICRVPTDINPSDGCSRGTAKEDAMRYGWELCRVELASHWYNRGPGMKKGIKRFAS